MSIRTHSEALAPTVQAIEAWLARRGPSETRKAGDPSFGVNVCDVSQVSQ